MVQRGGPLQQRDFCTRDGTWHDRSFLDISSQENRFISPLPIHPRVLPVETALKDCAGLSVKEFALFVLDDNGDEKAYTSTSLTPYQQRIFSERFRSDFHRTVHRATNIPHPPSATFSHGSFASDYDTENYSSVATSGESSSEGPRRRQQSRSEDTDDDSINGRFLSSRKRHRPQFEDDTPVTVVRTQQLAIGNEEEIDKFYNVRFKDMQQSACKIMGKAFVKLIEPKKQTHYPYTKGAAKAPPWWPDTTGEGRVRHKEPDHLLKPERISLLVHILKMIVEPSKKQCATVQKLGLNVKKLEDATMEAMSNWFNDKDHKENAQRRPYLKEIFKIAKAQERFKNGEIDGTTRISVQFGDHHGNDESDDDDPEERNRPEDDDEEEPASSGIPSETTTSPPIIQTQQLQHQQEVELFGRRPLPVRFSSQPQPQMEDHSSYNESFMSRNMNVGFQQLSPPAQDNRRVFPSSFQSAQQGMYTWQNNLVSNAAQSQFYVTTSPQMTLPPQSLPYQLPPPVSVAPQQSMLPPPSMSHYDGLPSGRYDTGPTLGPQLRTGSLGHPHHIPHGFPEYLQDNGYGQSDSELKHDPHQHMQS